MIFSLFFSNNSSWSCGQAIIKVAFRLIETSPDSDEDGLHPKYLSFDLKAYSAFK